jgi:[acyl-carrier-protein] S-malonyltransferase
LDLCLNGPKTKLDQTYYAQLAVFVSSLAAFEKMKSEQPDLMQKFTGNAFFIIISKFS